MVLDILFILFITIFILTVTIPTLINFRKRHFLNFQEAVGYVVGYVERENMSKDYGWYKTFSPIIEYEVDGMLYRYMRFASSSFKPKIGKKIIIKYNPNDPNDVVEKNGCREIISCVIIIVYLVGLLLYF